MSDRIDKRDAALLIVGAAELTRNLRKDIEQLFLDGDIIPVELVSSYNKSLLEYKQVLAKYNRLFGLVHWSSLRLLQDEVLDDIAENECPNE